MTILRNILLATMGWLLWQVGKRLYSSYVEEQENSLSVKQGGVMVRCAHCGLHIPESEATRTGENIFCCEEHRQLAQH